MDAYDAIRSFLIREQRIQNALTDRIRVDLASAKRAPATTEALVRVTALAGQLHDAGVREAYLGEALAGYPERHATAVTP